MSDSAQAAPVPTVYRRLAFTTLHWPGWSFEAAMQHPTRARIIDYCATYYEKKMEPIIPISRIEREANAAAKTNSDITDACPYQLDTDAGRLFQQFFSLARETITCRIQREANAAAQQHDDINDACPYPFGTFEGRLFKELFTGCKQRDSNAAHRSLLAPHLDGRVTESWSKS